MKRLRRRLMALASASWYGAAVLAGAALIVDGVFLPRANGPLSLLAALALGGLLVAGLAAALRHPASRRAALPEKTGEAGAETIAQEIDPLDGDARFRRAQRKADLELGAAVLVCAYAAFQATGGARSMIHPLVYALCAFLTTFHLRAVSLPLVAFAALLEVALAVGARAPIRADLLVSHLGFLALFALLHLLFLQAELLRQRREHRRGLAGELSRMRQEAREFRLISSQLGAGSRTRSREEEEEIIALGAVENIHQALFYTLELLKRSLDLHTCLLLWLDDDGQTLRIKELVTDSDEVGEHPIPADAGALGAVVKDRAPVRLAAPRREHLPYYEGEEAIGSFLAVPVLEGVDDGPAHLRGVLLADRLTPARPATGNGASAIPFDERDEEVLRGAARQILRAIQAERVFVAVERSKFEHERFFQASDLLNRTLTPEQVYATTFTAARALCPFDFAAITHFDPQTRRHHVVAAVGEGAAEVEGLSYGDNAGLVAMAIKNKHYLPAAGERRDMTTPIFTRKAKLRGMESLLVLPLIAGGEAIGSFTLAARAPKRFPDDRREMLGVIVNQVAVSTKNAEMYRAMEEMATTDGLTGLVNHRTFQERFADLLSRAERSGQPVSLLLTDIDHFKKVNDTHGHPVGDVVLKGVAAVCRAQVRKVDVAARYGGEEFAIVLDGTDLEGARQLAERIRGEVEAQQFTSEKGTFHCTLSLGIATWPECGRDPKTLIAHSDQALYHAKHNGRNKAVAWPDLPREAAPLRAVK